MLLASLFGCAGSPLISITHFSESQDAERLPMLLNSQYEYVRLHIIEEMHRQDWKPNNLEDPIVLLMTDILRDPDELCATRGQSAYALGKWQVFNAAVYIVDALDSCDNESRYWMVLGLENLATDSPIASGALSELQYDSDIFIRTEVQQWMSK
jgi:hypothetical protein